LLDHAAGPAPRNFRRSRRLVAACSAGSGVRGPTTRCRSASAGISPAATGAGYG